MYIKSKYPLRWKLQYIPSYYDGLNEEQQRDQKVILNFKNGLYEGIY